MEIIKKIKGKLNDVKEFLNDADNMHTVCDGIAVGTYIWTIVTTIQLTNLNDRVKVIERTCDTAFKAATNNDFKAFNNHMLNAHRIDAIIQALKSTHPGIAEMVHDAEQVAVDNYLALPYDT